MARKEEEFKIPPQYRKADISQEVDLEGIFYELDREFIEKHGESFFDKLEESLIRDLDQKQEDFIDAYTKHLDGRDPSPESLSKCIKAWRVVKISQADNHYERSLLKNVTPSSVRMFAHKKLESLARLPDDTHLSQEVIEDILKQRNYWRQIGDTAVNASILESSK